MVGWYMTSQTDALPSSLPSNWMCIQTDTPDTPPSSAGDQIPAVEVIIKYKSTDRHLGQD